MDDSHLEPVGSCSICGDPLYDENDALCNDCQILYEALHEATHNPSRLRWLFDFVFSYAADRMFGYSARSEED